LNEKVTPGEPIVISEETKAKYNSFKSGMNKGVDFAGDLLMKVYTPVSEKTKELKQIINTKIESSNNDGIIFICYCFVVLIKGKLLTVAAWDATGTAL